MTWQLFRAHRVVHHPQSTLSISPPYSSCLATTNFRWSRDPKGLHKHLSMQIQFVLCLFTLPNAVLSLKLILSLSLCVCVCCLSVSLSVCVCVCKHTSVIPFDRPPPAPRREWFRNRSFKACLKPSDITHAAGLNDIKLPWKSSLNRHQCGFKAVIFPSKNDKHEENNNNLTLGNTSTNFYINIILTTNVYCTFKKLLITLMAIMRCILNSRETRSRIWARC